jgi:hypothetical protein
MSLQSIPNIKRSPNSASLENPHLCTISRQRLVVERLCGDRIEGQCKLVPPAELKAGLAEGVVPLLGVRVALCQVSGVGGNLVGDNASLDVITVGQAEVLLGGDVAQERGAVKGRKVGLEWGWADLMKKRVGCFQRGENLLQRSGGSEEMLCFSHVLKHFKRSPDSSFGCSSNC